MNKKILFIGGADDAKYLPFLKGAVPSGCNPSIVTKPVDTLVQAEMLAEKVGATGIATTQKHVLAKLLNWTDSRKEPSLDNYQGSLFKRGKFEYLILNPLSHLVQVPYASFVFKRFISKISQPFNWRPNSAFRWAIINGSNNDLALEHLQSCFAASFDIETFSTPLAIRCLGFTTIHLDGANGITTHSYVLPLDSLFNLAWGRRYCATSCPKIFQNGKYDNAYLSMFRSPVYNWLWDTATLMHSYYAELPKDLAYLNSFFVRESMYWKDLAETNDLEEYYRYNALDTHATANVWINQLLELPEWARNNYLMEFPVNFPAHLCEMTGIKRDEQKRIENFEREDAKNNAETASLQRMVGVPGFNPGSPKQMLALLKTLTGKEWLSSDEKHLKKAMLMHPLNEKILGKVLEIRGTRKMVSTYLTPKEYRGRILYSLNPHGTDTGRLASKESHFWCGLQIQNIPTRDGPTVKETFIADDGFRIAEVDLSKAESWDTAFAAGEPDLMLAVASPQDFHSINASAFFGVPYENIFDDARGKTKDKPLRDLSKRVNHGANYCMGENVLVDTMGEDKVREAGRILGLPKHYSLTDIAHHLLESFHKKYKGLRGVYYPWIVNQVMTTKMLTGALGWTRYCFYNPEKDKRAFNAYVAHVAQSLNAMSLNKAFMRVFYEIQMHPQYRMHFKLLAQIHDSILFQFREGHEYLADMVRERMEIPITIKSADGVTRTYTVPADIKAGKDGKGAKRWSETE